MAGGGLRRGDFGPGEKRRQWHCKHRLCFFFSPVSTRYCVSCFVLSAVYTPQAIGSLLVSELWTASFRDESMPPRPSKRVHIICPQPYPIQPFRPTGGPRPHRSRRQLPSHGVHFCLRLRLLKCLLPPRSPAAFCPRAPRALPALLLTPLRAAAAGRQPSRPPAGEIDADAMRCMHASAGGGSGTGRGRWKGLRLAFVGGVGLRNLVCEGHILRLRPSKSQTSGEPVVAEVYKGMYNHTALCGWPGGSRGWCLLRYTFGLQWCLR